MASNKRILIIGLINSRTLHRNEFRVSSSILEEKDVSNLAKKTLTQNLTRNYYLQQYNYLQLAET